jgi:hypothetical protein
MTCRRISLGLTEASARSHLRTVSGVHNLGRKLWRLSAPASMLQLLPVGSIPSATVRVAEAAVPEGNTYRQRLSDYWNGIPPAPTRSSTLTRLGQRLM